VQQISASILGKAHELNPTDGSTMNSVKTVYTFVGEIEKAIEMTKKIEAVAAGQ